MTRAHQGLLNIAPPAQKRRLFVSIRPLDIIIDLMIGGCMITMGRFQWVSFIDPIDMIISIIGILIIGLMIMNGPVGIGILIVGGIHSLIGIITRFIGFTPSIFTIHTIIMVLIIISIIPIIRK